MDNLSRLESLSIHILREAYALAKPLALLWSLGKDSGVLIWLAKKAFFGHMPFPAIHLDTGAEFPEAYAFRDRYASEWALNLMVHSCPALATIDPSLPPASRFAARKSAGLAEVVDTYNLKGLIAGIRRDEQALRAKERVFSPRGPDGSWNFRDQPPEFFDHYAAGCPDDGHLRIHPLLHWTERDIWRYIRREAIPVVPLYFARGGQRYRSLGEVGITSPIASDAATIDDIISELESVRTEERQGRAMDSESEDAFERLRAAGYL
jgi:sulfate adenylyltransferase subunit 2